MDKSLSQGVLNLNLVPKAQGTFLGAALGDALGWPQEDRARRVGASIPIPDGRAISFRSWIRRSGGRFYPHEEEILAGEYSDDTQLLLCAARSRLCGAKWWDHLVARELPTWTLYERGGGGATKRAVEAWLSGWPPWSVDKKRTDASRYFQAGGNGVAMRIAPHCVVGAKSDRFSSVASNIVLDGVTTHGHPRALLGACAYGYAVWNALRQTTTLRYGELVRIVLAGRDEWAKRPEANSLPPGWNEAASLFVQDGYQRLWEQTTDEMTSLLEIAETGLAQGALSVDREVLEMMGAFDRKVNGSGTVAAAASIFLASRYAADPVHGILEAAFATGADTDTIASMVGAVLGALTGTAGLMELTDEVQDAQYLRSLAERLATYDATEDSPPSVEAVTKAMVEKVIKTLKASKQGDRIALPDGREANIKDTVSHRSRTASMIAESWSLVTSDQQLIYVKSLSRAGDSSRSSTSQSDGITHKEILDLKYQITCRTKLLTQDLDRSVQFYSEGLGLSVNKRTPKSFSVADVILLVPKSYEAEMIADSPALTDLIRPRTTIVSLGVPSLAPVKARLERLGTKFITAIIKTNKYYFFRCLDPDGNIVELFEL